ncbi:putative MYST-like histone acetyltransferase 1, partial [Trichinella zimbabwensis]
MNASVFNTTQISIHGIDAESKYNLSCIMVMPPIEIFELGYILSINENRICTPERPFSVEGLAAYWRYWLQRIMDYMAQKGTKRQFDIVGKPGF